MEEPLVDLLWSESTSGVKRALKWRGRMDVRAVVQAVRVRHFVEWFCGTGGLTTACSQVGLNVAWYDCVLDPIKMNLLSNSDMGEAILLALSLVVGGTAWFGVPCSTFVFMSRGHTKRTRSKPKGNVKRSDVTSANMIVERVSFLIKILAMRKVYWIMEQPMGSLLWYMPAIKRAKRHYKLKTLNWQRRFLWLGHYGHSLLKPTELVGVFPGMESAWPTRRPAKRDVTSAYSQRINSQGRRRVDGRPGLKATEHYPPAFCDATASLIKLAVRGQAAR